MNRTKCSTGPSTTHSNISPPTRCSWARPAAARPDLVWCWSRKCCASASPCSCWTSKATSPTCSSPSPTCRRTTSPRGSTWTPRAVRARRPSRPRKPPPNAGARASAAMDSARKTSPTCANGVDYRALHARHARRSPGGHPRALQRAAHRRPRRRHAPRTGADVRVARAWRASMPTRSRAASTSCSPR